LKNLNPYTTINLTNNPLQPEGPFIEGTDNAETIREFIDPNFQAMPDIVMEAMNAYLFTIHMKDPEHIQNSSDPESLKKLLEENKGRTTHAEAHRPAKRMDIELMLEVFIRSAKDDFREVKFRREKILPTVRMCKPGDFQKAIDFWIDQQPKRKEILKSLYFEELGTDNSLYGVVWAGNQWAVLVFEWLHHESFFSEQVDPSHEYPTVRIVVQGDKEVDVLQNILETEGDYLNRREEDYLKSGKKREKYNPPLQFLYRRETTKYTGNIVDAIFCCHYIVEEVERKVVSYVSGKKVKTQGAFDFFPKRDLSTSNVDYDETRVIFNKKFKRKFINIFKLLMDINDRNGNRFVKVDHILDLDPVRMSKKISDAIREHEQNWYWNALEEKQRIEKEKLREEEQKEEQELRKKGDSISLYKNKKELEEDRLLDDLEDEYDEDYEEEEEEDGDEEGDEDDEEEYEYDEDDDFIVDDDEDGIEDELDEAEKKIAMKKRVELEPFKRVVTYYRRRADGKLEAVPVEEKTTKLEPEKSNQVEEEKKSAEDTVVTSTTTTDAQQ